MYMCQPLSPQNVEDLAARVNTDEDVRHGYKLEVGLFGVGEVNLKIQKKILV